MAHTQKRQAPHETRTDDQDGDIINVMSQTCMHTSLPHNKIKRPLEKCNIIHMMLKLQ